MTVNIREHITEARITGAVTAIPVILVNVVATTGQYMYLRDHLPWPMFGIITFAAALESVALYLAYMAHKALIAMDNSFKLRMGAFMFGLLAGFMNYSHYSHGLRPTFTGIATGIMSASSPLLWGVYSRRMSRDALMERGLIEPGAVRLGSVRWLMHPAKSYQVFRDAAWTGERNAGIAITDWEAVKVNQVKRPDIIEPPDNPAPERERDSDRDTSRDIGQGISNAQAVRVALDALGRDTGAPEVVAWLADRGRTVTPGYVRQIKTRSRATPAVTPGADIRALPGGMSHGA